MKTDTGRTIAGGTQDSLNPSFDKKGTTTVRSKLDTVRRRLIFGTGIGIEVTPQNLNILVVKVSAKGATIMARLLIHNFAERPPRELGAHYKGFLRQHGVAHVGAVVLLPYEYYICRTINLPGVTDRLIPAALRFELDAMNPWDKEKPVHDWVRVGTSSSVLVAVAPRRRVEGYVTLFEQAGIRLSHFTCDAAVLYASIHMLGHSQRCSFLAIGEYRGERIIYGESPSRPLLLAHLDTSVERARSTGVALLQLPPDLEADSITKVVPTPLLSHPGYDPATCLMPYVAALCGANPWFGRTVNLLPTAHRRGKLRAVYVPTCVLATLLVLAVAVLAGLSTITDRYNRWTLQAEIQMIGPLARESADLDRKIASLHRRAHAIDTFRVRSKDDLDALSELTQLLRSPTWLRSFRLTRQSLQLSGEAEQAATLLKIVDDSIQFSGSEFSVPVTRAGTLEGFSVRAKRKVPTHESL